MEQLLTPLEDDEDEEMTLPVQGRRFSQKAWETERLETEQSEGKPSGAAATGGVQTPPLEEQMRRAVRQKAGARPLSEAPEHQWGQTAGQGGGTLLFQLRRSHQQTKTAFFRPENPTGDLTKSARPSAAEPVNWDALAEREARRYDGGFSLF